MYLNLVIGKSNKENVMVIILMCKWELILNGNCKGIVMGSYESI